MFSSGSDGVSAIKKVFFRITCILEFYNLVGPKFSSYTAPTYFLCLKKTLFFYKQCNGFPGVEELMSEIWLQHYILFWQSIHFFFLSWLGCVVALKAKSSMNGGFPECQSPPLAAASPANMAAVALWVGRWPAGPGATIWSTIPPHGVLSGRVFFHPPNWV